MTNTLKNHTRVENYTSREALKLAIRESLIEDEKVFLMGEEVAQYGGAYKISSGLFEEFGEKRIIDTPISEYGFAGIAAGAAMYGLRPIVEFMSFNFSFQAIDHIINSAAKTKLMSGGKIECPIVFRGPNGMAAGVGAQHSHNLASLYANIPGLIVVAPFLSSDHYHLLKESIKNNDPVIFLEHELLYGIDTGSDERIKIGQARILKSGKDLTLVSFSHSLMACQKVAKELQEIIDIEVIDLVSLRPLDISTVVQSVKKTNNLLVVEEGWESCGVASEIIALMIENCFYFLDSQPVRICGSNSPLPYSEIIEATSTPHENQIKETILNKFIKPN